MADKRIWQYHGNGKGKGTKHDKSSSIKNQVINITLGSIGFCVAIAYSNLSEKIFNTYFEHEKVISRVIFCIILTIVILLLLYYYNSRPEHSSPFDNTDWTFD